MFIVTLTSISSNMNHSEIKCALSKAVTFSMYAATEATETHREGFAYSEILIGYSKGGEFYYYELGPMENVDDLTLSGTWRKKGDGCGENWRSWDVLPWLVRGVDFENSGFPTCVAWRDADHFSESGMLDLLDCESSGYLLEFIGFTGSYRRRNSRWVSAYIWKHEEYKEPTVVSRGVRAGP